MNNLTTPGLQKQAGRSYTVYCLDLGRQHCFRPGYCPVISSELRCFGVLQLKPNPVRDIHDEHTVGWFSLIA